MKSTNHFFLLFIFSCQLVCAQNISKDTKSGKIIFDITYENAKLDKKNMDDLPSEAILYFKDNLMKMEMSLPMGKTTFISNHTTGSGTMLMDMMGSKFSVKMDKSDLEKEMKSKENTKVAFQADTKLIAGYICKKAIVTIQTPEGEKTMDTWFTNELKIKNSFGSQIDGIEGFLMEFYTNQNGMSMKMKARSLDFTSINDSEFIIPEGYTPFNMDALKKIKGGK